jgi:molecular chaperone Hsp33
VQLVAATVTDQELAALADRDLLRRLFAEDDVRMFESAPVFFRCRCSRDRVATMLKALGQSEITGLLAERGVVEVRCEFCNRAYHFDAIDVEALFLTGTMQPPRGGPAH